MSFRISTTLVRAVPVARHTALRIRAFHSPFTALGDSPLTSPTKDNTISSAYEKNYDHPSEPVYHSGLRTYVVSEPDAHSRHYQVPAGAYPTLAPYVKTTSPPTADPLAHDTTTADPPRDPSGVGENTAFRNASAPGTLGVRGGGYGGLDKQGAAPGTERLADRTLSDGSAAEKYAKTGGS